MIYERVCRHCPIYKTCPVKLFSPIESAQGKYYAYCNYFTCDLDGLTAAIMAYKKGKFEKIIVDRNYVLGARFGTKSKPTENPDSEYERLVDDNGKIIIKTPDQEYKYNGQDIQTMGRVCSFSESD